MKYDFDTVVDRAGTFAAKYEDLELRFGKSDLLPLWIADMDLPTAAPVVDAIRQRAEQGIFGYTSRPDSYFRAAIDWYEQRYGYRIEREWLVHSPCVVTTLAMAVMELTEPGDKIVIQPPVYYPFFNVVQQNNRVLVENPLREEAGRYVMDYADLEIKLADNDAKFLILCNPHNPGGRVWTREELARLGEICLKYQVRIISDEIHCDLTFAPHRYVPLATVSPELNAQSIICLSATKSFNLAGLQASVAVVPDIALRKKLADLLGRLSIERNNCFSMVAIEAAYRDGEAWLEQMLAYVRGNIDYVMEFCRDRIPQICPQRPEGTYLIWLDCRGLGLSDEELAKLMIDKAGVALNKGAAFGSQGSGFMRMNVACARSVVKAALERIEKAVKTL
ncbi:MAG TPA: MalY/PatB family protein [Patescibacteria group bacterium]|nr:MalY/PatB family protein [Patescibacteria group bacterium]